MAVEPRIGETVVFTHEGLDQLVAELARRGFDIVGPTLVEGVIDLRPIVTTDDLPTGWTDAQGPGRYRSERVTTTTRFAHAVGPNGAKRRLHPPEEKIWTMRRTSTGELEIEMHTADPGKQALFGIKPCDLAGIAVLDEVLAGPDATDPAYRARRDQLFLVVVNCAAPASTCFCTSMGTGPFADDPSAADIVLTELIDDGSPRYLARAATPTGLEVLATVEVAAATDDDLADAARQRTAAEERIERRLPADRCHELLDVLDHAAWDAVGDRCLACGNCTLVCPTCFCTSPDDRIDLTGETATRTQVWDHCFDLPFSQMGSNPVRQSTGARYRQWATHKLASWIDQFGVSGCVGCGRCITWCPVGIDIVSEANTLLGAGDP